MKKLSTERGAINKKVQGVLTALSLEFVLGMIVNLYGSPPDESGKTSEPLWTLLIFVAHGIIGLALLVGSIYLYFSSRKTQDNAWEKVALQGMLSILLAGISGLVVVALKEGDMEELASFTMAIGFILAFIAYGRYFLLSNNYKD